MTFNGQISDSVNAWLRVTLYLQTSNNLQFNIKSTKILFE